jgi:hypothetical protein
MLAHFFFGRQVSVFELSIIRPRLSHSTNLKHDASILSASQNLSSQLDAFVQNSTVFDQRISFSIQ